MTRKNKSFECFMCGYKEDKIDFDRVWYLVKKHHNMHHGDTFELDGSVDTGLHDTEIHKVKEGNYV